MELQDGASSNTVTLSSYESFNNLLLNIHYSRGIVGDAEKSSNDYFTKKKKNIRISQIKIK